MRVQITDQFVKRAVHEGRGSPIHMDADVIGFGVQLRASGRKTFTLDYSFEARRRRIFIGNYPEWTVAAARGVSGDRVGELVRDRLLGHSLAAVSPGRYRVTAPPLEDVALAQVAAVAEGLEVGLDRLPTAAPGHNVVDVQMQAG